MGIIEVVGREKGEEKQYNMYMNVER